MDSINLSARGQPPHAKNDWLTVSAAMFLRDTAGLNLDFGS
jgi:hypothetical protein